MPFRCAQVRANRPCGSHPILSQKTKAISPGYGFERPRLISRAGSLSLYSHIERGTESSDTLRGAGHRRGALRAAVRRELHHRAGDRCGRVTLRELPWQNGLLLEPFVFAWISR